MITDVYVVFDNDKDFNKIGESSFKDSPFFHFIDARTLKGKKESFRLKGSWSAKLNPFALCLDGDKPVKAFYSEAEDVIESLINYLK